MSLKYNEIVALPNGAHFVRADLHIHSTHSHEDVTDPTMTPAAIVDAAIERNIQIIAITDHHTIDGVTEAIDASRLAGGKVLVIPGIELSTNDGHLLVYFDPANLGEFSRFIASLTIIEDEQGTRVQGSMLETIKSAKAFGGICVAAHIDADAGLEKKMPGYTGAKRDLITARGLSGIEYLNPDIGWYSGSETSGVNENDARNNFARLRREIVGIPGGGLLAQFCNSDAHNLSQIGRQLTRIKVTDLTYDAFRNAIADPSARVRIDSTLPTVVPKIDGIQIIGGFLDGTCIHFSQNLNILFGGRGTGKSTALKAIAFTLENAGYKTGDPIFQQVELYCEAAAGAQYRFSRAPGGSAVGRMREQDHATETQVHPSAFRIEYFAQGELNDVARTVDTPGSLQRFLDRHISVEELRADEQELVRQAQGLARQLAPFITTFKHRDKLENDLKELEDRLKQSEQKQIKQVAEVQNKLVAERTLRNSVLTLAQDYRKGVPLLSLIRQPAQMKVRSQVTDFGKPTEPHFQAAIELITRTNEYLTRQSQEISGHLQAAAKDLEALVKALDAEHARVDDLVQKRVAALKGKGLAASIADLNQMSANKTKLVDELTKIESQRPAFEALKKEYGNQSAEIDNLRQQITELRTAQLIDLNKGFKDAHFHHDVLLISDDSTLDAEEYQTYIDTRMEGCGLHRSSINELCEALPPRALADALDAADVDALVKVGAIGGRWAQELLARLGTPEITLELRLIWRPRAPRFKIIDKLTREPISFDDLSGGQKHTILLTIALLSDARHPLIIDQPEDDLDNKFIYDTVVRTLRRVKESRQVILVTHNANIAVLGDSELLLEMVFGDGHGKIKSRGSIDDGVTKTAIIDTLEGGRAALQRRLDIYGPLS